jgi:hypothetical protein
MRFRKPERARTDSRKQVLKTRAPVLDERPKGHDFTADIKKVCLDLLVGRDRQSCDIAFPCGERFLGPLPADLPGGVAEKTIGGEIVHRNRDDKTAGYSRGV